jgi:enamine deaminase RidA (YjgF/YER057c/UK114 family)
MYDLIKISSGTKWEDLNAYSRAIKINNRIIITGTTAVNDSGEIVGIGSMYEQTKFIFSKFEKYLNQLGASYRDVVINRVYVTDISKWEEAGKAHSEIFKDIKPCLTLIGIKELVMPDMLVEIECEAVCSGTN